MPKHDMRKSDSSRIQSSQAKGGGDMSSSGFASRAQSAGDRSGTSQAAPGSQGTGTHSSNLTGGFSGASQRGTGSSASSGTKK